VISLFDDNYAVPSETIGWAGRSFPAESSH
jgi:hypothetical protein